MQPHHTRILHGFDARSILLFATLTMGGTQAVLARSELAEPRATTRHSTQVAPAANPFDRTDAYGHGTLTLHDAERLPAAAKNFAQPGQNPNGALSREAFVRGIQPEKD